MVKANQWYVRVESDTEFFKQLIDAIPNEPKPLDSVELKHVASSELRKKLQKKLQSKKARKST